MQSQERFEVRLRKSAELHVEQVPSPRHTIQFELQRAQKL